VRALGTAAAGRCDRRSCAGVARSSTAPATALCCCSRPARCGRASRTRPAPAASDGAPVGSTSSRRCRARDGTSSLRRGTDATAGRGRFTPDEAGRARDIVQRRLDRGRNRERARRLRVHPPPMCAGAASAPRRHGAWGRPEVARVGTSASAGACDPSAARAGGAGARRGVRTQQSEAGGLTRPASVYRESDLR
jgi:hypothetical protein